VPVVRAEAFNVVIHYIDSVKKILGSHNIESAVQELKIKSTHYQKEVIHAITTQLIGVVDGAAYCPNNVMDGIFIMVSSVEN